MERNNTITCAVTAGAGRVAPSTASVFRAVGKDGFGAQNGSRSGMEGNGCGRCDTCNGCDECNSWNNTRRSSNCGTCNHGCNASSRAQTNCNPCDNCSGNSCNRSGKGCAPGMVYEQEHDLCQLHEAGEAIRKGTLFPQLYMPMRGECADGCGAQLCEGQAEAFAAWELRLYLNTHPCDQQALHLFRKYARKADQPNYAGAFADGCGDRWSWTDAPWPWEFNAACEDTCGC
jgi:spore coat protein JB